MKTALLRNISFVYLLIPNLIFSFSWFRWPISVLLVLGQVFMFTQTFERSRESNAILGRSDLLKIGLIALAIIAYSGLGGLCFQAFDYWGLNSKYYTLFNHSWPVVFRENGQYACHYFGFFLVPALISKATGDISGVALYLWASAGLFLGICWIFILTGKNYFAFLLFLSLGGVGHVFKILVMRMTGLNYHVPPFFTEIWAFLYQAEWAPNQLIPILLVSCIIYHDYVNQKRPEKSFFAVTSVFIWGIFPSIVFVIIFSLLFITTYFRNLKAILSPPLMMAVFVPGLLFIPTFFYFLSGSGSVVSGFIWQFQPLNEIAFHYFFGVVVDLIALYVIVIILGLHQTSYRNIINGLFIILFFISLIRMGRWNDWFLRGSTPIVTLLALFILTGFSGWVKNNPNWFRLKAAYPVLIVFFIGMVVPVTHVARAVKNNVVTEALFPDAVEFTPYPYNRFEDFYQMGKVIYSDQEARQFLGQKGSLYERYFSR